MKQATDQTLKNHNVSAQKRKNAGQKQNGSIQNNFEGMIAVAVLTRRVFAAGSTTVYRHVDSVRAEWFAVTHFCIIAAS